jgi:hypothetical protein
MFWVGVAVIVGSVGLASSQPGGSSSIRGIASPAEPRANARLEFWVMAPSPYSALAGHFVVDYSQPQWSEQFANNFDSLTKGKVWRFGKNFWTTLDASMPVVLGGEEIESGYYYLAIERSSDDQWELLCIDPIDVAEERIANYQVGQRPIAEVARIPLKLKKTKELAKQLNVQFQADSNDDRKGDLIVHFGPYQLRTGYEVDV